jgi:hypothetical protein
VERVEIARAANHRHLQIDRAAREMNRGWRRRSEVVRPSPLFHQRLIAGAGCSQGTRRQSARSCLPRANLESLIKFFEHSPLWRPTDYRISCLSYPTRATNYNETGKIIHFQQCFSFNGRSPSDHISILAILSNIFNTPYRTSNPI